ncbi:Multidrug export protein mepA [uncultured Roseburia sp.]|uniref:Multidrug export protein MepA n=1 Tax=Brotonthovivens ammoniilytica TaxID=2981725 RepID=A0ABT2TJ09_9FIRM|nr:MATE family efflux transporter [Brotonthovivens ammoniilytica]MCU6762202.1 MATE family efflux transporter [Brotonthovivens ammoniilytica]SCI58650.1 Multidrug export protein mepA [uncultured Roseburia sp.]
MSNTLAKKFDLFSLIKFALPNTIMMVFLSMYVIVDGIFISRFVGTTALSAVNMVFPALSIILAVAIMIATGGSAIIARRMGEGKEQEARTNLSFLVLVEICFGILVMIFGNLFLDQIVTLLGASAAQFEMCRVYARIIFLFAPCFALQTGFETFFVTAGKPTIGLSVVVVAGITNIVLDYVFIVPLQMGILGAALGTGIGTCIPALSGILFFLRKGGKTLYFVKPEFDGRVLLKTCANGSSEMVTNLSNAVTTFLFNYTFMKFFGENGVASITIILYFQYIFTALYFGYSNGIAPVISFKYGQGDTGQLKQVFKNSVWIVSCGSVLAFIFSRILSGLVIKVFTPEQSPVYQLTLGGISVFSIGFLLMGISIFASALFTALSDGFSSAVISFARTFVFLVGAILLLPNLLGENGVWLSVPAAEACGIIVTFLFLVWKRKKYQYC